MPDTIDKTTPADSDLASAGAAQFRALKTAIENRMAIPDAVAMSTFFPFVTTVTDTYTQLIQDGIIICNKGTAFNLTVLAAANCSGRVFRVKNIGAGVVTLVGTIGGVVDPTIVQNQMIEWFSDGTSLYLFMNSSPGGVIITPTPAANAVPVSGASFLSSTWMDFTNSQAASGYTKLPNGIYIQWGTSSAGSVSNNSTATVVMSFPIAFPNNCFSIAMTVSLSASINSGQTAPGVYYSNLLKTGCNLRMMNQTGNTQTINFLWMAIGN